MRTNRRVLPARGSMALPYPDLQRVWARVQATPFAGHPELEMVILDPDGQAVAEMAMVDVQFTYISLTMHLKLACGRTKPITSSCV